LYGELWPGKPKELKRKVAEAITEVIAGNIGCPGQTVTVLFTMGKVELDLTNIQISILSGRFPSNNWLTNIGFPLLVPITV
jgi:hypothetical protein